MKKYEAQEIAVNFRKKHAAHSIIMSKDLAQYLNVNFEHDVLNPMLAGFIDGNKAIINSYIYTDIKDQNLGNIALACLLSAKLLGIDHYKMHLHHLMYMEPRDDQELLIFICALNLLITDEHAQDASSKFGESFCDDPIYFTRKYDDNSLAILEVFHVTEVFMELRLFQAGFISAEQVSCDRKKPGFIFSGASDRDGVNPPNYEKYFRNYLIDDVADEQDDLEWEFD